MADKTLKRREAIKGMDDDKLKEELTNLKKEQFNLRFQQATGTLEKAARIRVVRRDICLLYTSPSPRDQRGYRMPSSA